MWRCGAFAGRRALHTSSVRGAPLPRMYRYWIDVHGQLFLYDTVPKNLTSCFKSVPFLNFFFARVQAQPCAHRVPLGKPPCETETEHWTQEDAELARMMQAGADAGREAIWTRLQQEGMAWVSPCQGEWNVIHAIDTPIVFRQLTQDGHLVWGGNYTMPWDPAQLRVHPDTGYLYHPSPMPPLRRVQARGVSPYGPYSLIASHVVLQHFADGLHMDLDAGGGTLAWGGREYALQPLSLPSDLAPPRPP
ncbi:hypothetical protein MCAP1_001619 [Malassezia caprae]|uniref:Uncharacterized protein n=1 Tax=Malassezia caprae TaxID=1381934 RepID=A0AAF0IV36_9BASI|nr:hypothetical protein MCAP1_001619 [Malassezia caprae]